MSALEKIRKHPGLLIGIIGVATVIFLYQIVQESKTQNGRSRDEEAIVTVDKDQILYSDYVNLRDRNIESMKRSTGGELNSAQTYSVYNSTLEQLIKNNIMTKEYKAVGMSVSSKELHDLFLSNEPHEYVAANFKDENGVFNPQLVESYLQMLEQDDPRQESFIKESRAQWVEFENAVRENQLEKKFDNLLKASYFVPSQLAEKYYNNKNEKTSADVVVLRYDNIDASLVEVTDQDNKKFYEENKYKYETDATRDIEYVVFELKPSAKDNEDALNSVNAKKDEFAAADDVISYINDRFGSDRRYDSTWMGRKDVPAAIEQAIFDEGNQPGFVVGPYFDGEAYNLARIVEFQNRADSLKASHILVPYVGAYSSKETVLTKEMAQKRADSIANVLKKNPKDVKLFGQLAGQFSSDKASAEKEGDLDWFRDGVMVYDFNEFVMNNKVGQIGVVETPFGFHVIKVTGKTEMLPKVRLAVYSKNVTIGNETIQKTYDAANMFASRNRTLEQFDATVEEQGMTKRVQPMMNASTFQITGIENPREIVQWAFKKDTKVGDVSTVFTCDNMYVVAALTGAVEEGYAPMEKTLEQSKFQILNMKKGEVAVSKMQACGTDYDRMVSELGAENASVSDITMESRSVGNFGIESNVVGTILGMKEGEVVGPIAGNTCAFIIKSVKHNAAAPTTDYSAILREKKSQFDNKVLGGGVYSALRNKAKIEDNRVTFY